MGYAAGADETDGRTAEIEERPDKSPIITLQVENDYFASEDDSQYTHGMRLSYYSGADEVTDFVRDGSKLLPFFAECCDLGSSFDTGLTADTAARRDESTVVASMRQRGAEQQLHLEAQIKFKAGASVTPFE